MALPDHVALVDLKNRLPEVIDRVEREHARVVVTKDGKPAAVLLSVEDLESLEETLSIVSNSSLVEDIRNAELDVAAGRTERLSREQALVLNASGPTGQPRPPEDSPAESR